ncbi:MAG: YihY family inner membrane protein [Pseudomonadota bacterium]|nr:YihY family inner membrane protein [Pseudomonadota bacterium]
MAKLSKLSRLFFKYLRLRTKDVMILRVAAALSYTTLIAVVPLIVIALAIFAAFPVFEDVRAQVQSSLIEYFVPNIEQNIQNYIMQFVAAASKLTTLGVLGIAVTAILLLSTIENSFNFIFKVKKHRSIATKITLYWTIITLCPLLVGTAFSLKGYLLTLQYFHPEHFMGYNFFMTFIVPNLITFIFLWLSYVIVPNKKIRPSSAFAGACATLILTLMLRIGFGYFLILNVTYRTLYGALATVPIVLIWMYSWWTIVLWGAVITATIEEFRNRKSLWK